MKINLRRLVENYILEEDVLEHIGSLIEYFKNKPLNFGLSTARYELSKFIENPEVYDALLDATGEFVDLDAVFENEEIAQQTYDSLPEKMQNQFYTYFTNKKPHDPQTEPAYKFITVKKQLPQNTLIVRFVGDGQFANVQQEGGFTIGTQIMDRIHATEYYGIEHKQGGGYIYGYVATSPEAKKQAKAHEVGQNYGANCIFFKYPALLVNHSLDGEDQVIVYGPDVQSDECIFAKGVEDGKFVIMNGGFNKDPKTYDEIIKLLGKI